MQRLWKSNSRFIYLEIAFFLSLAIAFGFLGKHLLDSSLPGDGDVRSHIFKIEIIYSYISRFSWPQWVPYWYEGIPLDQYYPPGFYFIGAVLNFIFRQVAISYKALLLITMMFNGLAVYYFARRFLRFDGWLSLFCLLAYETSTPFIVNFMLGEGPNLLGWGLSLFFLAVYLGNAVEGRVRGVKNYLLPAFLLGLTILVHPFPAIFAIMAVILFHIIRLFHFHSVRIDAWAQFKYMVGVLGGGAIIGAYYWIPAMLTLKYASSIYALTKYTWPGATIYIIVLILLALAVGLITRPKIKEGVRMDFLITGLCLASALGFGAVRYLPLGLGSLVQDFRYATITTPFLAIMLLIFPLNYLEIIPSRINAGRVALAIVGGLLLTALIFYLDQREAFNEQMKNIIASGAQLGYNPLMRLFSNNFPQFVPLVLPYISIFLVLALSLSDEFSLARLRRYPVLVGAGACLIILVSVIPYMYTDKSMNISRIFFSTVDNYEKPDYARTMQAVKNGRLIVSMVKGDLTEGDSPVVFGWHWGVETVNGSYNQGDPKFFKHTVHLEWSDRWLDFRYPRENLMQESAAKYIFLRGSTPQPRDITGLKTASRNSYGQVMELDQEVSRAVTVTPVLLDVQNPRIVTEFFNILLPRGYRLVFVDIRDVSNDMKGRFQYVLTDNAAHLADYAGHQVFFLNKIGNAVDNPVAVEQGVVQLNVPLEPFTSRYFYQGDEANGYWWIGWDAWPGAQLNSNDAAVLQKISNALTPYLDKMLYNPVAYRYTDNRIEVSGAPGFTLIKDSYFPYWKSDRSRVISSNQGFMLTYSDSSNVVLNYVRPLPDIIATVLTLTGLVTVVLALAAVYATGLFRRRSQKELMVLACQEIARRESLEVRTR